MLQLDSVSVAVRAHYAPVFSRLGPYDRDVLDRAAWSHQRTLAAAARRVLGARGRADGRRRLAAAAVADARVHTTAGGAPRSSRSVSSLADDIVAAVAEHGPSTAGQIEAHVGEEARGRKGPWWDRSDTKWVTEALWSAGVLTTATRVGFARHYDLTERVLPPEVVAREVDDDEAVRELTLRAAGALGIATEADIRDYFRLSPKRSKPAIAKLVADGELEPVEVDGWAAPAYLRAGQIVPRRDRGTALLCPFDPLIFFRPRVERLFGIPLPHRDLRSRAQAPVRLLRMAVPA